MWVCTRTRPPGLPLALGKESGGMGECGRESGDCSCCYGGHRRNRWKGGKEGEGRRVVVGGSEGRNKGMARVLEFDGPTADRGPPAALRRLYLDKRLANAEVVRRAFAEVGGDCERGSGSRETTGVIEVSVWEAEEKKLLD